MESWGGVPATAANEREITHHPPRLLHREHLIRFAGQGKVGPQDTAEKAHAIDDDLIIVEYMDIRRRGLQEFVDQIDVVVIELVVAGNVNHGLVRESGCSPAHPFVAYADIAREHDGIDVGRFEGPEFNMQIVQDVEFH